MLGLSLGIRFGGWLEHRDACCEFTVRDLSGRLDVGTRSGVLGTLLPWDRQQHDVH
jgi:hypothetical protein